MKVDIEILIQIGNGVIIVTSLVAVSSLMAYFCGFGIMLGFLAFIYVILPFCFHYSSTLQRHIIFMHSIWWGNGAEFFLPETHGIIGGRNLYLEQNDQSPKLRLGVWHILPKSLITKYTAQPETDWNNSFREGQPIVVYFHGNMGSRATGHRRELYSLLQNLDYHVIAFDYSGFGDSGESGDMQPTTASTLQDGLLVYNWVRDLIGVGSGVNNNGSVPVFFWGHSLGTGVSSLVLSHLHAEEDPEQSNNIVTGLILESPFTTLAAVIMNHPIARMYCFWPGCKWLFVGNLKKYDFAYETDVNLNKVDVPIQIFHATNDPVIPFRICQKLINSLRLRNDEDMVKSKKLVSLQTFDEFWSLSAHAFICRSFKLPACIIAFTETCIKHNL